MNLPYSIFGLTIYTAFKCNTSLLIL